MFDNDVVTCITARASDLNDSTCACCVDSFGVDRYVDAGVSRVSVTVTQRLVVTFYNWPNVACAEGISPDAEPPGSVGTPDGTAELSFSSE